MIDALIAPAPRKAVPINLVTAADYKKWLKQQPARAANWLKTQGFDAKAGKFCVIPDAAGNPASVVAGISDPVSMWDIAGLPRQLPAGTYVLNRKDKKQEQECLALGWLLGTYQYSKYKKNKKIEAKLALTDKIDARRVGQFAETIALVRDLINTPAEDMGPVELAAAITAVGKEHGAKVTQIIGNDLLKKNYPAVHTVGRAAAQAPRLVDLTWGNPKHPRVTLVGKGVCFDTGGLDIKPSSAMYLMRKDMAGAAIALGIAKMIMSQKLPVRLRVLIPAVENSVSGNAFRPTDIITMRNGLTVEVGNTDAEGRLILADALTEAVTEQPEMLIDFSTLTGAARTAVGAEISALFSNNDKLAEALQKAGDETEDPLWRLPLHDGYEKMLESSFADVNSCPNSPYAGAITAALFLQRFVGKKQPWVHLDFMAWNLGAKPGRPEGGEPMTLRAVYRLIEQRFGSQ